MGVQKCSQDDLSNLKIEWPLENYDQCFLRVKNLTLRIFAYMPVSSSPVSINFVHQAETNYEYVRR